MTKKSFLFLLILIGLFIGIYSLKNNISQLQRKNTDYLTQIDGLKNKINQLENEDPRKTNTELQKTINQMKDTYKKSVSVYEKLIDLRLLTKNTQSLDQEYAKIINFLANENYASASSQLDQLNKDIIAAIPTPPPVANPPTGQIVKSDVGDFSISLVSADLSSTRVTVDTASDSTCTNNCPVLPLATYVARNGAYAGINGSYFCPASYPSCAGKTNSFDLLLMNKNKIYFNSDNNIDSNNPGVIFGSGYIRFVSAVSQWGRDTSIDSMLSNYPLLIQGNNIVFGGNNDPKMTSKSNRSFVGNRGNTVYIGVVFNASVVESAHVLKSLGLENALNLDDGGSAALWSGGYKVGPGRDLPNVILFVRK